MNKTDDSRPPRSCPEFALLTEHAEGALDPRQAGVLDEHLRDCRACAQMHGRIRDTIALMKESEELLVPPPAEVERRVVEMGRTALRQRESMGLPVVFARLARVGPLPVPAGVRGAAGGAREFLYECEGLDLRVQLRPGPGGAHKLRGHAYPRADRPTVLRKVLLRPDGGGPEVEAAVSGERGFQLAGLSPGDYSLVVQTEDRCIHCPDFKTGR